MLVKIRYCCDHEVFSLCRVAHGVVVYVRDQGFVSRGIVANVKPDKVFVSRVLTPSITRRLVDTVALILGVGIPGKGATNGVMNFPLLFLIIGPRTLCTLATGMKEED